MPQSLSLSASRSATSARAVQCAALERPRIRWSGAYTLLVLGTVAGGTTLMAQEGAPPVPPVVLDSLIEWGRQIYLGGAGCARCHGEAGRGTSEGPDLTDDAWLRGSGRYEEILAQVRHGVSRRDAATGKPMPIGGWEPLSEEAARAVAVYVWSIGRRDDPRRP